MIPGARRLQVPLGLAALLGLAGAVAGCVMSGGTRRDPAAARRHLEQASRWALERQFSAAVAEGERALALDPDAPGVHRVLGYACYRLKRYPEARAALEKALLEAPEDAFITCFLGLTCAEHPAGPEDEERARELLERAVPRYQGAEAWYGLGLLALRNERWEEAIRYFRAAVRSDSGWETGRYRLAEAYRLGGRRAEAEREARVFEGLRRTRPEFERLVAEVGRSPRDPAARLRLARLCLRTERYREALEQFQLLAEAAPGAEVFRGLAEAAERLGRADLVARARAAGRETAR